MGTLLCRVLTRVYPVVTFTLFLFILYVFSNLPVSGVRGMRAGNSGRCVTLRQIKDAQMFLHHFVCSVHFPVVHNKHTGTGIEAIPHAQHLNGGWAEVHGRVEERRGRRG